MQVNNVTSPNFGMLKIPPKELAKLSTKEQAIAKNVEKSIKDIKNIDIELKNGNFSINTKNNDLYPQVAYPTEITQAPQLSAIRVRYKDYPNGPDSRTFTIDNVSKEDMASINANDLSKLQVYAKLSEFMSRNIK